MRVLVCGGRRYAGRVAVWRTLHELAAAHGWLTVIQGCATGADTLAREWAVAHHHGVVDFPADWKRNGKYAGPIRNQQMLDCGRPDLVIAFPGGSGTADMVARARRAGLTVQEGV